MKSRMYEATLEQLDFFERSLDRMHGNDLEAFYRWVMSDAVRTNPRAWEIHLRSRKYR